VLHDRLRELTGVDMAELAGGSLDGEVPLTDAVVTRLAQRYLPASAPIADLDITARDHDVIAVRGTVRGSRLLPALNVEAVIDRQPELPHSPLLGLRWSLPGFGPLAMFAGPALSFFKALPPGITLAGDRITVDLAHLLRARGLGDLLPHLTRLRVTTRQGAIVVTFGLRIR
jgi:hypothetical protein